MLKIRKKFLFYVTSIFIFHCSYSYLQQLITKQNYVRTIHNNSINNGLNNYQFNNEKTNNNVVLKSSNYNNNVKFNNSDKNSDNIINNEYKSNNFSKNTSNNGVLKDSNNIIYKDSLNDFGNNDIKYNNDNIIIEEFNYMFCLAAIQSIFAFLISRFILNLLSIRKYQFHDKKFFYAALCYSLSSVFGYLSLRYVNYFTHIIGKSARPIPVIIFGSIFGKKIYNLSKYINVTLIVLGIIIFSLPENEGSNIAPFGYGEVLIFLSLCMDGLTSTIQAKLREEIKLHPLQIMYKVNYWNMINLSMLVLVTGEFYEFLKFIYYYPFVIIQLILLGVCSSLGQMSIYFLVTEYGPLTTSIVTTTRKFFSVLITIFIFGTSLILRQWFGVSLVFGGLFFDAICS